MDVLVDALLKIAVCGAIGFVAALVTKTKQPILAHVGAGFAGTKLGDWLGGQMKWDDPLDVRIRGAEFHLLFGLALAIVVLLLFRLVRTRAQ
jgi:uncharacterized membrane protein YeaQ/YmgE (transglycosylase-associated protein family)